MQLIRAADLVAQPWKNGGGVTREIAVFPPGAGMDDFDWRISAAEVAAPGPFSRFPDIDRTLLVTRGAGLSLAFGSGGPIVLTADSDPLNFAGDAAVHADLVAGPVSDLNVMTRRGRWSARVERRILVAETTICAAETTLVVALAQTVVGGAAALALGDALRLDAGETAALGPGGTVAVIDLRRW